MRLQRIGISLCALAMGILSSCTPPPVKQAGIGEAVSWEALPGWQQDQQQQALPALLAQCPRMVKKATNWKAICDAAKHLNNADSDAMRAFMQRYFQPHEILGLNETKEGLITGYYEPILNGSRTPSERYRFPLYKRPQGMLQIDLGDLYPELKGKRVRGRIEGNKVVPFYDRAAIDGEKPPLVGEELLWVDDPTAAFFLHVQGSGRVRLEDGSMTGVGYADQNGHPYRSIGKVLIERGELTKESVTLFTIAQWLQENPSQAQALLNENPSYVFFVERNDLQNGPRGSLNVPLTAERSVAIDRKIIPLGTPLWLSTQLPDSQHPYQRLVFAQDTGGAINGPVRADLFFGSGEQAERYAGTMKQRGQLFALLPKGQ